MLVSKIEVALVEYKDKEVLRNLMEYYLYDFSEMEHFDVDPHGRFEYKYLDHYWTESDRHPYFILVDGMYAGFILVNQQEVHGKACFSIAEFFIMRKYRKKGIGESVAGQVFDRHRGDWVVSQMKSHIGAQAFWRKVLKRYTDNRFQDVDLGDGRPTQIFNNTKEAE